VPGDVGRGATNDGGVDTCAMRFRCLFDPLLLALLGLHGPLLSPPGVKHVLEAPCVDSSKYGGAALCVPSSCSV